MPKATWSALGITSANLSALGYGLMTMTILAIHGGAGGDGEWRGLTSLDPERIRCMHHVLNTIGDALESGSIDALEAVTQAVELMEDEPLFNAGIGSVLDEDGTVTMDASIMNGAEACGALLTKHPDITAIMCGNDVLAVGAHQDTPLTLSA